MKFILNKNKKVFVEESESESEEELKIKSMSQVKSSIKKLLIQNKYIEYELDDFNKKLGKYTIGLDKVIPWEDKNFVLGGGLLCDIINDRFDLNLVDIDLFFYGSVQSKLNTLNKIFNNLDMNQYNYIFGYIGSVIYIFIQGVPRIIQLIMTNKSKPEEIIDTFDLSCVQFYSDGKKIYGTEKSITQLDTGEVEFTETHKIQSRLVKYLEKGYNSIDKLLFDLNENRFILNFVSFGKILSYKIQKNLYKSTYNLTIYSDLKSIDFNLIDRNKLDLGKYFDNTAIYYSKPNNKDLSLEINMVGNFLDYFDIKYDGLKKELFDANLEWDHDYKFTETEINIKYIFNSSCMMKRYKKNILHSLCLVSHEYYGFYLDCEFVDCEDFYFENNLDELQLGKRVYFKLENNLMTEKILKIINYENIKFHIDSNTEILWSITTELNKYTKKRYDKYNNIELKKYLDKHEKLENIQDKIFTPIENTKDYTNQNSNFNSNKFIEIDGIVIRSNIYNLNFFENINGKDFFEKIDPGQKLYCAFKYFIYILYTKPTFEINKPTINMIDINLQPSYIYLR